jgi:hypothetical protein
MHRTATGQAKIDTNAALHAQTRLDMARIGAEVARLARVAAAVHEAQQAADARDEAIDAQIRRDQASRLRMLMRAHGATSRAGRRSA